MKKALGLAFALALAFTVPVAAETAQGTVSWIDTTDRSIVLEDGTRLSVSEGEISRLSIGDQVQAAYETKGERKVVTQMARRGPGLDGSMDPLNSYQAAGDE